MPLNQRVPRLPACVTWLPSGRPYGRVDKYAAPGAATRAHPLRQQTTTTNERSARSGQRLVQSKGLLPSSQQPSPIVFEPNDPIYVKHGMSFSQASELAALGLVSFGGIGGYSRQGFPKKFRIAYGSSLFGIELKEAASDINIGKVIITEAGRRLAPLTKATAVPEFADFVTAKWRADGHKIDALSVTHTMSTP